MSFKRFDTEDIALSAESVVAPAWTNQITTLVDTFTGSQAQSTSGKYYLDVYQTSSTDPTTEVQFSVAYGNVNGSGSTLFAPSELGKSPSSVIYGQYRTLVNGDENTNFNFGGTVTPNSIYVISVNRSRYKEKLLPGSFALTLQSGSIRLRLIDDSSVNSIVSYTDAGRVYDIVSGTLGAPYTSTAAHTTFTNLSGSYGKFLPDVGVIILNANALRNNTFGVNLPLSESRNSEGLNNQRMYSVIAAGDNFTLRSEETVTSNYIFVRVRNNEFNYSTNPSNITGSGELLHTVMVNTPQAYITTVGLYNDNNDLLAVAKLSKPLLKDFTKEALVRIKLDY
jgi:hypothetical protein